MLTRPLAGAVFLLVALAACTGESEESLPDQDRPDASTPPAAERVELGFDATWDISHTRSLSVLLEWRPHAFVGAVVSATSDIDEDEGIPANVSAMPRYSTSYEIEVEEIITSDGLAEGDGLSLYTLGGVVDSVEYFHRDDPLMRVGERYVFFAVPHGDGGWLSGPNDRMRIDSSGRLVPVADQWTLVPALLELTCLPLNDGAAAIVAAAAESPPLYGAPPSTTDAYPTLDCDATPVPASR